MKYKKYPTPTEPGWYWLADDDPEYTPEEVRLVRLDWIGGRLCFVAEASSGLPVEDLAAGEYWASGRVTVDPWQQQATRYPWGEAPLWAGWAATDADGEECWYEYEPMLWIEDQVWEAHLGTKMKFRDIAVRACADWQATLERRPSALVGKVGKE
jgi:hypothetical protein